MFITNTKLQYKPKSFFHCTLPLNSRWNFLATIFKGQNLICSLHTHLYVYIWSCTTITYFTQTQTREYTYARIGSLYSLYLQRYWYSTLIQVRSWRLQPPIVMCAKIQHEGVCLNINTDLSFASYYIYLLTHPLMLCFLYTLAALLELIYMCA